MSPDGAATGAPGPQPDDDPDGRISRSIGLRDTRDRKRRERAVIQAVRDRSHGRSREDIAADLARSFAGAGIPQLPEAVALHAGFLAEGRLRGVLRLLGTVRHGRDRQARAGTRPAAQRLAGDRWIGVTMSGDPAARSTVRWWKQAHRDVDRLASGDRDRRCRPARDDRERGDRWPQAHGQVPLRCRRHRGSTRDVGRAPLSTPGSPGHNAASIADASWICTPSWPSARTATAAA